MRMWARCVIVGMYAVPAHAELIRIDIENAVKRGARCMDGSPAIYYVEPAEPGYEDRWVVWFEGGGTCGSADACRVRHNTQPFLTSTTNASATVRGSGILSSRPEDNPDFWNWNRVLLNYCSSDTWSGDAVAVDSTGDTWEFNGRAIVRAVFEDLADAGITDHPIDAGDELLVTGTSAGGGGVSRNINDIAALFPGVNVKAVIDSSYTTPTLEVSDVFSEAEWSVIGETRELQRTSAYELHNTRFEGRCALEHAATRRQVCFRESLLDPYWDVPVFLTYPQYQEPDFAAFRDFLVAFGKTELDRSRLIEDLATALRVSLGARQGVFLSDSTRHGALDSSLFTSQVVRVDDDAYSLADVLGNWYFEREGYWTVVATPRRAVAF